MFDQSAIQELKHADDNRAMSEALHAAFDRNQIALAIPEGYTLESLEGLYPLRQRPRGLMSTNNIESFALYFEKHASAGATVFVGNMTATAVLNLGSPEFPGHADDLAKFAPDKTAAFMALERACGQVGQLNQRDLAEFFEDWSDHIKAFHNDESISNGAAATTVRTVTVDAAKKMTSVEATLEVEHSAMESLRASSSAGKLPTRFDFTCEPYLGMQERKLSVRISIHPTEKTVGFSLRIAVLEAHKQEMQAELADRIHDAINGGPVIIGSYAPSK